MLFTWIFICFQANLREKLLIISGKLIKIDKIAFSVIKFEWRAQKCCAVERVCSTPTWHGFSRHPSIFSVFYRFSSDFYRFSAKINCQINIPLVFSNFQPMEPTFYGQDTENTRQRSNSTAGGPENGQNDQFGMQSQLGKMVY